MPMSLPDKGAVKRKLPIGIQTFRLIREEGCYYVDKTAKCSPPSFPAWTVQRSVAGTTFDLP